MARGADPQALFNKALATLNGGDAPKAARLARRLSKQAPHAPEIWHLRAMAAQQMDAHKDAIKYLRRAIQINPGDGAAYNNMGNAHRQLGKLADAGDAYGRSLELRPGDIATAMNLGDVLMELHRYGDAQAAYQDAVNAGPDTYGPLLNLAAAMVKRDDWAGALAHYQRLAELGYDDVDVLQGLYQTSLGLGRLDDADTAVARLLDRADGDPKYHHYASILYLLSGRWREGWQAFAARWRWQPEQARPFSQPWWQGEALQGRTLMVWGEQGVGDEVMFAAMIPDLAKSGGRVLVECDRRLLDLFRRSFPGATCIARAEHPDPAAQAADLQVPSSSLGIWLRRDEKSFGGGAPYLAVDAARAEQLRHAYRARFDAGAGKKLVGITWQSLNPEIGDRKSMTLDDMAPLFQVPDAVFVNLQYGDTSEDRADFQSRMGVTIHHDPDIDPLVDIDGHTAQIAAMDLIISISNSTVHLAGAIGVPTWVIVQKVPDRRWLMDREDSPWYGSVRLFRQRDFGDWSAPVAAARDALLAAAGN